MPCYRVRCVPNICLRKFLSENCSLFTSFRLCHEADPDCDGESTSPASSTKFLIGCARDVVNFYSKCKDPEVK